jgi:glycerate kinase
MAEASGLCLCDRREPLLASTKGTGELMLDARANGAHRITVFIGGSATCDGGIGMAEAFGYRFYDRDSRRLACVGGSMPDIARIVPPEEHPLAGVEVICASDVTNPTYGENGAAFVFAPQKGASPEQVLTLDRGLRNLACVVERDIGTDVHTLVGGGAAGGLGAGLYAFASAKMRGGFCVIADILGLEREIELSDAVITGEGCTDMQSVMGKVVGSIARIADKHSKRCILISGLVKDAEQLEKMGIYRSYSCMDYAPSVEESMRDAVHYITLAASDCAREL